MTEPTTDTPPPRLLIVEDEAIVVTDIAIRLKQLGYEVVGIASSGEESISMAATAHPDLVLMDIHLRGAMDGVAAAREMRARFRIPVVFLTAYAEGVTFQRAKEAEPLGYVLKPFDDRELRIAIDIALYKHNAERLLQDNEEKFRMMVETIPLAICLTNGSDHTIQYLNPMMIKLFGYTLEDIPTTEHWWALAYPEANQRRAIAEEWISTTMRAADSKTPNGTMETIVTCKDKSTKIIAWSFIPIGDKTYACGLDLTERKLADDELKTKFAELERFNKVTVGRELRMIELKQEINALLQASGQPDKYRIAHEK
jgi:PAS domain S-box-containing protein